MEYKKIVKMLDNTPNQPLKFKTKTWLKKKKIVHVKCITPIVKLNLKLQC